MWMYSRALSTIPSGVSPYITVSRSAREPWLTPIRIAMSRALQAWMTGSRGFLDRGLFLADLDIGIVVGPSAWLAEDK